MAASSWTSSRCGRAIRGQGLTSRRQVAGGLCFQFKPGPALGPTCPPTTAWPHPPSPPGSQVLVKSRALELLVEGYLSGCTASDAAPLAALLAVAAHPAAPAGLPGALAAAVVGLGELATLDPLSGAAQARQSAGAAVALLKSGVAAPAERGGRGGAASQLGGLAAKLEALEAQLPKTTSLKEQVRLWGDIFSTTQQKLDVVRGAGSARAPPEVAAALGPLDGLHGALEGRMKVGGARVWTALCRRMHACMLACTRASAWRVHACIYVLFGVCF